MSLFHCSLANSLLYAFCETESFFYTTLDSFLHMFFRTQNRNFLTHTKPAQVGTIANEKSKQIFDLSMAFSI